MCHSMHISSLISPILLWVIVFFQLLFPYHCSQWHCFKQDRRCRVLFVPINVLWIVRNSLSMLIVSPPHTRSRHQTLGNRGILAGHIPQVRHIPCLLLDVISVYNSAIAFLLLYFFYHNWDSMQFCEDTPQIFLCFSHRLISKQTCYNHPPFKPTMISLTDMWCI